MSGDTFAMTCTRPGHAHRQVFADGQWRCPIEQQRREAIGSSGSNRSGGLFQAWWKTVPPWYIGLPLSVAGLVLMVGFNPFADDETVTCTTDYATGLTECVSGD
jgi:hypothetical protein